MASSSFDQSPTQPDSPATGPLSYQPTSETIEKHEVSQLRSDILLAFDNQFPDLSDEDPNAGIFIDQLSFLTDKSQLTSLKEEFAEYTDGTPEDWILVLTQEVTKEQKRLSLTPQAEKYCDLYFSNVEDAVRARAKESLIQLLVDGYVFTNLIEHISSPVRAMEFVRTAHTGPSDYLYLYPNGEIHNGRPSGTHRQSNESSSSIPPAAPVTTPSTPPPTPDSDALSTLDEFTEDADDDVHEPGELNSIPTDKSDDTFQENPSDEVATLLENFKSGVPPEDLPEKTNPLQKTESVAIDTEEF